MTGSGGLLYLAALAGGYLAGSVPFGLVLTRMAGLGDIRQVGSGNIGATNVLRTGNKTLAFLTVVLDAAKGGAAAWIVAELSTPEAGMVAGFAAVVGHNFPVWLGFKGGKGVATTLGVHAVVAWPMGALAAATWLLVAGITRYSSAAALAALAAAPFFGLFFVGPEVAVMAGALAVLAIVRHRANIVRLCCGEEPKIGQRAGG